MKKIDSDFDTNLKKARALIPEIEICLNYSNSLDEDLPEDLGTPCSEREVEALGVWERRLYDKAIEFLTLAENMQVSGEMREILHEIENDQLPDEGNPGYRVGQ